MLTIDGYQILERIYSNAHINAYRCLRLADERQLIVKTPYHENPSFQQLAALRHEYNLLKRLALPNVIKTFDFIEYECTCALVLEDINGVSLEEFLAQRTLKLDEFFKIAQQLVIVIGELHQHNIIHKDIKPSNIIIKEDLQIKLIDLSISSELTEEDQEAINPHLLEGTLAYLSPEQTGRMNRPLDYRTDFYSLGITLFEMLTGRLPFQATDPLELVHCHLAKPAPLVSELTPQVPVMLAHVIDKLLAKMPEERYSSVTGILTDLAYCAEQWRQTGDIQPFVLSNKEVTSHLQISHKLYGRETQVATLLEIFARVCHGSREILYVTGYAGIGKTSLIREIYKPITQQRGHFISGKFDQLQHSVPYSAIIAAFQQLIKQLMAEPEEKFTAYKAQLQTALGANAQFMIEVIPDLGLIIEQPAGLTNIVDSPTQAQNRFNIAFQKFVQVFSQEQSPLVIFLDDLQWADAASLNLIELLLTELENGHLLVLCAYRDNEVGSEHLLNLTKQALTAAKIQQTLISLQPLTQPNIETLLQDTLSQSADTTHELAKLLLEKTQGNPFFINEFLKALVYEKLLCFSYQQGAWQWNIQQIRQKAITDNVVDLLLLKIQRLPEQTQAMLKWAACIGHIFDLQTLAIIAEQPLATVSHDLWEAIKLNLILPVGESYRLAKSFSATVNIVHKEKINYRFSHDRIQQASYQLVPQSAYQQIHLTIGRLLLNSQTLHAQAEQLFEIVEQFNKGLALITDPAEQLLLAEANLWAGQRAKAATAYPIAKTYLDTALQLLPADAWENYNKLSYAIYYELAEVEFLSGRFELADTYFKQLINNAQTVLAKANIYQLKISLLASLNKQTEVVELGLNALALLGLKLPNKVSIFHILKALIRIKLLIGRRPIDTLNIGLVSDPKIAMIFKITNRLNSSLYQHNPKLFLLMSCQTSLLALKYGYSKYVHNLLGYVFIQMHLLRNFNKGFEFIAVIERAKNQPGGTGYTYQEYFNLAYAMIIWRQPLNAALDYFSKARVSAIEAGDLQFAFLCSSALSNNIYLMGKPLQEVFEYNKAYSAFREKYHIKTVNHILPYLENCLAMLQGAMPFDLADVHKLIPILSKIDNRVEATNLAIYLAKFCYLFNQFELALQIMEASSALNVNVGKGTYSTTVGYFYHALSITACYSTLPAWRQRQLYKKLLHYGRNFNQWAKLCSVNFAHYELLISAEIANLSNNSLLAMELYDQAIKAAQTNSHFVLLGIANECAARFYLKINRQTFASLYLHNAYYAYQRWGAKAKLKQLEQSYTEYLKLREQDQLAAKATTITQTIGTATISESLDIYAITKSTQAIASEIQLDKLLQALLRVVLEEGGAQRGLLLTQQDGAWRVEVEGTLEAQQVYLEQVNLIETRTDLPLSLVHYVNRTRTLLTHHSSNSFDTLASKDSYLKQAKPKSWLLLPIVYKGVLKHIFYIENLLSTHEYSAKCLQSLQLIASQAVISLENAQFYYQASHDHLTRLANRSFLRQAFVQAAQEAANKNTKIAILFFDLDHFKQVNDTLGHDVGDQLLIYVAVQLKFCLFEGGLAVRLGGDEFVVMLEAINNNVANQFAERFLTIIDKPAVIAGHELQLSSSIGISIYPKDGMDIETLLKNADIALYRAKKAGRGRYQFYSAALNQKITEQLTPKNELLRAINNNELCLYYQPIYDPQTTQLISFEALIRWQHPKLGLVLAETIIQIAEKNELIDIIGKWILHNICQQLKIWQGQGLLLVPFAMNLSALQFQKTSLSQLLTTQLKTAKIEPSFLELELTESALFENNNELLIEMQALKAQGFILTLDDFGTGYNNLAYLKYLPISKLKIDRSFVKDIAENSHNQTIALAIIAIARALNLEIIAEGVETEQEFLFFRQQQIDGVQGYYFSQPLTAASCEQILSNQISLKKIAEK